MPKLLLVEDDADVRLIIEHMLLDAGHDVDATGTMAGAIELLEGRAYDLVIADGRLPDGSGMTVADRATEQGRKALIITGYAFTLPPETRERYEILLKPLRGVEIVSAVQRALRD